MKVDIAFLPDRERLMLVVRDIKASHRAFPLVDIASRFLEREDSHVVRLELPMPKTPEETRKNFYQCRECKRVFTTRANAEAHVLSTHMGLFFAMEEVEAEPPSGTFTCVARCGFSGELLGPPNFHAYNERINELWSTRFSHMPKADYLARIETVRDEASIEEWKKSVSKKTVYRRKLALSQPGPAAEAAPAPEAAVDASAEPAETVAAPTADAPVADAPAMDAPVEAAPAAETPAEATSAAPGEPAASTAPLLGDPMDKTAAQAWIREHELARLVRESPRCMIPGTQARRWDDPSLRSAVDSARYREKQFPYTLLLALRPAFRHMHLHLFKINARETYVTAIPPMAFDEATADDIDREIMTFLRANEGPYTRKTLLDALRPGIALESPEASNLLRHIVDMVAHGVLAELFNGNLFLPVIHPADKPAGENGEKTAETLPEVPADTPPEVPAEVPAEAVASPASEAVAEAPAEAPTASAPETPAEAAPEAPAEPVAEAVATTSAEASAAAVPEPPAEVAPETEGLATQEPPAAPEAAAPSEASDAPAAAPADSPVP